MRNLEALTLASNERNQSCADTAAILGNANADFLVAGSTDLGNLA
jgi:hypothetical protein